MGGGERGGCCGDGRGKLELRDSQLLRGQLAGGGGRGGGVALRVRWSGAGGRAGAGAGCGTGRASCAGVERRRGTGRCRCLWLHQLALRVERRGPGLPRGQRRRVGRAGRGDAAQRPVVPLGRADEQRQRGLGGDGVHGGPVQGGGQQPPAGGAGKPVRDAALPAVPAGAGGRGGRGRHHDAAAEDDGGVYHGSGAADRPVARAGTITT
mmetsp:Transcript_13689/g.43251  ORF Transcript_13689/g.43251 Transcript_13689/m.43251 type:complete len:209 (+) Transcript_13689:1723-2349(+)